MDNQVDSESYWNRSTSKAFNFDDEDEGNFLHGADKTEADGINAVNILNDDAISEASFDNNNALSTPLNLSIKSLMSTEVLNLVLQEQTLDDKVLSKGVPPEEELKILRRQIQTTLYSPSPEGTAYKLLLGKQCALEVFKSLHEKEQLLDAVLANGGGDAVISVLIFLQKTLKASKFHSILQKRSKALHHYISYLTQRHVGTELGHACDLMRKFVKHHEAALQEFSAIIQRNNGCAVDDVQLRHQKLHNLIMRYSASPAVVGVYQQIFQSQLALLELVANQRHALDNLVDADSTPIEVLYACCRKNTNWTEPDFRKSNSPHRLCAEQHISPALFEWTGLNERASAQAYADLECIFERIPTWHPLKQKQFHISFSLEAAIKRLFELKAPPTVLYLFVSKMGNANDKLELAQKVKCVKGTIDALGSLKDIAQLTQLKESLPQRSEEQFYCEKVLKGLQSKRWSTDGIKIKL